MKLPKYFYFRVKSINKGTGMLLEDASDADVVEVVRCRDCESCIDGFICTKGHFSGMTFPNNFCSEGRRNKSNNSEEANADV